MADTAIRIRTSECCFSIGILQEGMLGVEEYRNEAKECQAGSSGLAVSVNANMNSENVGGVYVEGSRSGVWYFFGRI